MFVHTLQVRFRDLDAYNHVNNAVYLTYFEEARIAFITAIGMRGLFSPERSTVIAHAEIDYRAPAQLGDRLDIAVRTGGDPQHLIRVALPHHAPDRRRADRDGQDGSGVL